MALIVNIVYVIHNYLMNKLFLEGLLKRERSIEYDILKYNSSNIRGLKSYKLILASRLAVLIN